MFYKSCAPTIPEIVPYDRLFIKEV